MYKLSLTIIVLLLFVFDALCSISTVRVSLFQQNKTKTIAISTAEGKYLISTEKGYMYKLRKKDIIYCTAVGDSICVWDSDKYLGTFKKIYFKGLIKLNYFKIEETYPELPSRFYEGDLEISTFESNLEILNYVSINNYLSGVVEAESGPKAPFEFYKSQAIISRTYLYEIIKREGDDYFLCDNVNHQVYKGMCHQNLRIRDAVQETNKLVIVDAFQKLITAAFYSNSGGQTANSEDVWISSTSYLKTTPDPFSLDQKNTEWNDTIETKEWIKYLNSNGFNITNKEVTQDNLRFEQKSRLKYYSYKKDTLSLRKIRQDFKFRSTWFSIDPKGDKIIFRGRGYGHGVGLSQEGAMQMARQNFSFLDIIHFYYKNVKVVDIDSLFE